MNGYQIMIKTMTHNGKFRPANGFTLIELMIAVVLVGILGSLAYPSYLENVRRSSRGDASAALNTLANDLERFYSLNSTYSTDLSQFSLELMDGSSLSSGGKYLLNIAAGQTADIGSSYVITAIPRVGTTQEKDTDCLSFSLSSTGVRVPNPNDSSCW